MLETEVPGVLPVVEVLVEDAVPDEPPVLRRNDTFGRWHAHEGFAYPVLALNGFVNAPAFLWSGENLRFDLQRSTKIRRPIRCGLQACASSLLLWSP